MSAEHFELTNNAQILALCKSKFPSKQRNNSHCSIIADYRNNASVDSNWNLCVCVKNTCIHMNELWSTGIITLVPSTNVPDRHPGCETILIPVDRKMTVSD